MLRPKIQLSFQCVNNREKSTKSASNNNKAQSVLQMNLVCWSRGISRKL